MAFVAAVLGGICRCGGGAAYCATLEPDTALALFVVGLVLFTLALVYTIVFCLCVLKISETAFSLSHRATGHK